jgi:hypothetical protein
MFPSAYEHHHRNNNDTAYDITLTLSLPYALRSTLKIIGSE